MRYYKFRDASDLASSQNDCSESGGCAFADALYSPCYFSAHEQAHVQILRSWHGPAIGLLDEGVAVALSCDPRPRRQVASHDWRSLLYPDPASSDGYAEVGRFVTYLAQWQGWSRVRSLYERSQPGISADDFEIEFARAFPTSVDQAWRGAQAAQQSCVAHWICRATPMMPGDLVTQDCDAEIHRSIAMDAEGVAVLSIQGKNVMLWKDCGGPAGPLYELSGNAPLGGSSWTTHWIPLDAGNFTLTLMSPFLGDDFANEVKVRLDARRGQPLLSDACDTAAEVRIDSRDTTEIDFPSLGAVTGWIRLSGGRGNSYAVTFIHFRPSAAGGGVGTLQLCSSCDLASCVSLDALGGSMTIPVGEPSFLHLVNLSTYAPTSEGYPGASLSFALTPLDAGIH